ncbi:hypothetical protein NDU88_001658 [Pleurodeles waltl]|uniref:Uncharacterized protein n=1 Tax=Pleurodeles waltl TaxID=8319 RepID=A0AAV7LYL5_PLEWA|nr:hypothetical protein NDU88_001658 [Pleurodeles waltl]
MTRGRPKAPVELMGAAFRWGHPTEAEQRTTLLLKKRSGRPEACSGPRSGLGGALGREVVPFYGGGLGSHLEAPEPRRDPAGPRESRGHGGGLDPRVIATFEAEGAPFEGPGWGWRGAPHPHIGSLQDRGGTWRCGQTEERPLFDPEVFIPTSMDHK